MVDDESKSERRPAKHMQSPNEWDLKHNPAYNYYCFYIYANLYSLNKLREARGLTTFSFRPHAGENLVVQLVFVRPLSTTFFLKQGSWAAHHFEHSGMSQSL